MKNKRTKTGGGSGGGREAAKSSGDSKTEPTEEENDEVDVEYDDDSEEKDDQPLQEAKLSVPSPPLVKTESVDYPGMVGSLYPGAASGDLFSRFSSYHHHHHLPFQHKLFGAGDGRASDKGDY